MTGAGKTRVGKLPRFAVIVHSALWALLLTWTVVVVLMPPYNSRPPFGIYLRDNGIMIVDFPSYFNFVKAVWSGSAASGRTGSVYSIAHHLKISSDWSGQDISQVLPFGYSPTMLWVLAPLVTLTHASAYCLLTSPAFWPSGGKPTHREAGTARASWHTSARLHSPAFGKVRQPS